MGSGKMDNPGLQWLPKYIQHVATKLGQLVEEKDSVVRQAHLLRTNRGPTANQPGVANGVMRRAERAARHQRRSSSQHARNRVNACGLERLVQSERGQDPRESARQHGLAGPGRPQEEQVVRAGGCALQYTLGYRLTPYIA